MQRTDHNVREHLISAIERGTYTSGSRLADGAGVVRAAFSEQERRTKRHWPSSMGEGRIVRIAGSGTYVAELDIDAAAPRVFSGYKPRTGYGGPADNRASSFRISWPSTRPQKTSRKCRRSHEGRHSWQAHSRNSREWDAELPPGYRRSFPQSYNDRGV